MTDKTLKCKKCGDDLVISETSKVRTHKKGQNPKCDAIRKEYFKVKQKEWIQRKKEKGNMIEVLCVETPINTVSS
jgi:ssDNA-binding Zn-finger/Zn-ribbon topoisomerase 1